MGMACCCSYKFASSYRPFSSFSSLFASKPSHPFPSTFLFPSPISTSIKYMHVSSSSPTATFTWDDFFHVSQSGTTTQDHSSYLQQYFHKAKLCNRGYEKQSEFLPFVIEGHTVGFIHNGFVENLRGFSDVFIFPKDKSNGGPFGDCVSLHPMLETAVERTSAVDYVVKCLGEEHIPGIRNELTPVKSSFGGPIFFSLERAAAPCFGIKAYGVHLNGYVELNGQEHLWPHGIDCRENIVKECKEEAGIPRSIAIEAIPVSAVSYMDIDGYRYRREVLFCYDLKLPESFVPKNEDGEVDSFKLIPVMQVAEVIQKTQFFKPNFSLVIIDFLFRHGYITPEYFGYLDLLRSLRMGDCS